MGYKKQARYVVNPTTIKKHSDIVFQRQLAENTVGPREHTPTGFRVSGATTANFELYTEVMAAQSATNTYVHPKKSRSYRVLNGSGLLILNKTKIIPLLPGITVTVDPGVAFRVVTAGNTGELEFLVVQDSKYEDRLKLVESDGVSVEESTYSLVGQSIEDTQEVHNVPRRRGSKVKEQLKLTSAAKKLKSGKATPQAPGPNIVNVKPARIVDGELVER